MDDAVLAALATDRVIDITTIGRTSGRHRRIDIWYHRVGGKFYLSGLPGRRIFRSIMGDGPDYEAWVAGSPLVKVTFKA